MIFYCSSYLDAIIVLVRCESGEDVRAWTEMGEMVLLIKFSEEVSVLSTVLLER